jgi:hypothetical protein
MINIIQCRLILLNTLPKTAKNIRDIGEIALHPSDLRVFMAGMLKFLGEE